MGSEFYLLFEMPNVMMFDMRVIYSLSHSFVLYHASVIYMI